MFYNLPNNCGLFVFLSCARLKCYLFFSKLWFPSLFLWQCPSSNGVAFLNLCVFAQTPSHTRAHYHYSLSLSLYDALLQKYFLSKESSFSRLIFISNIAFNIFTHSVFAAASLEKMLPLVTLEVYFTIKLPSMKRLMIRHIRFNFQLQCYM